ncbi:MAG: hypothetical protein Q8Q03_02510, partial [bacterium]|nr:hypothetical protein [bacterium]
MKRLFLYLLLLIILGFVPQFSFAQLYPVRDFVLDTLGKKVVMSEDDLKGTLFEYKNEEILKIWKVEYEQKSNSRKTCIPPVLNIKFDSKGKNKDLFAGITTYRSYSSLGYAKIRLVPDCDVWVDTDFFPKDSPNILLREFFVYKTMRHFGIPTLDVVGFANIRFKSPDILNSDKAYPYMLLQRNNEKDDQVSFTRQFNILPAIQEANKTGSTATYVQAGERLSSINYVDNNSSFKLDLEPKSSVRYFLLSEFLNSDDHFVFWNEDYGRDSVTGMWKTIPFDFDMSLVCGGDSIPNAMQAVSRQSQQSQPEYKSLLYQTAREIFDNPRSLQKMLSLIDSFPLSGDKAKLKNYITMRFYRYALYYGSPSTAKALGQVYQPYKNESLYLSSLDQVSKLEGFNNSCDRIEKTSLASIKSTFSISAVSPYAAIIFVPDRGPAGTVVTLYWRGAATDVDNIIELKNSQEDIKIPSKSEDGISIVFTIPSTAKTARGGDYDVSVSNSERQSTLARTFTITPSAEPVMKKIGLLQYIGREAVSFTNKVIDTIAPPPPSKLAPSPTPYVSSLPVPNLVPQKTSITTYTAVLEPCSNPSRIITVGGIGSGPEHPIFSYTDQIDPTGISIPLGGNSVNQSRNNIRNAIRKELDAGNHVLVVAHSLGGAISFNLKDEFDGQGVDFIYADPPYNSLAARFDPFGYSSVANEIKKSKAGGIASDPNTIEWTNGSGSGKNHDPWTYPDYKDNDEKLENLKNEILEKMCNPPDPTPTPTPSPTPTTSPSPAPSSSPSPSSSPTPTVSASPSLSSSPSPTYSPTPTVSASASPSPSPTTSSSPSSSPTPTVSPSPTTSPRPSSSPSSSPTPSGTPNLSASTPTVTVSPAGSGHIYEGN